MEIRKLRREDVEGAFELMRELAIFEGYIDSFKITPEIVIEKGLGENPDFYCYVAVEEKRVVGILVYYYLNYTAQNKKSIYMKELYVSEECRGKRVGESLFNALREEAKQNDVYQIKWTVADWNENGKKFYKKQGAEEDSEWINYALNI